MAVVSNQSQVIEAFSKHLQELVKDSSFQYVNNLVNDKVHLEQVNTKLESARDGFIDAIAKLRRQVGEAEKEAKDSKSELKTCQKEAQLQSEEVKKASIEIAALKKHQEQDATVVSEAQESVNKKQDTITQLEQQLTQKSEDYEKAHTAQKDLHVHYNVLRQRYDAAKSSLDGYAALTSGVTEMTRESIVEILERIMLLFRVMVVTYLNVDLEDGALTRISNAKNTKHSIPCLNSNTSEAKCMRIAAALRTAADALERYIFQPTYLLENNDLCEILSDLAEEDPSREAHIRAVLQPIQPSSDSVTNRIRKCVEEIDVCIRPMVLDGKQREFRVALSEACEQVHRDWARLQKHKGRIEVSFDANSAEKWNLLTGYILKDLRKAPSSGDSSVNSNDGQTANRRSLWSVDFNQTGYVVWPTFIFEVADEQWTTPCVVLSLEQIARARDEQNSHRGKRKNSRRESTSMSSSEGAKVDGSFLSEQSPKMPNGG